MVCPPPTTTRRPQGRTVGLTRSRIPAVALRSLADEGFVGESSTEFLAGTKTISIADYLLLDLIDTHAQLQPARSEVLFAMFPKIAAWKQGILARPKLAAYLASDARRK